MKRESFRDCGFTLIEVVLATVIVMIALIPIMGFFSGSRERYARSLQVTTAVNLAQEKMEELLSQNPEEICPITPSSWEPFPEYPGYKYQVEVICDDVELELYTVLVRVKFAVLSNEKEISLSTYYFSKQAVENE
ncbi:MAG: type II secretion system protein [Desulfitobacteriaceae bacterium]|nr:type II secretion system protein [Desulfitobacteriaceae bacterium]